MCLLDFAEQHIGTWLDLIKHSKGSKPQSHEREKNNTQSASSCKTSIIEEWKMSKFVGSEAVKLPVKTLQATNMTLPIWSNPSWNSVNLKRVQRLKHNISLRQSLKCFPHSAVLFLLPASYGPLCVCAHLCVWLYTICSCSLWPVSEPSAAKTLWTVGDVGSFLISEQQISVTMSICHLLFSKLILCFCFLLLQLPSFPPGIN